jgi:hypothetical protein
MSIFNIDIDCALCHNGFMNKLTDNEVAASLYRTKIKLRALAHFFEYHRLETIPLDVDQVWEGISDLLNELVNEIHEIRNALDPSCDEDDETATRRKHKFRRF